MSSFYAAATMAPADQPAENTADPKAHAMKTRVLTHMTADHADSLALFLRHYCHLPASQVPINPILPTGTIKLEDIDLDHMIITHPNGRNLVPIKPPMKSMSESRERLVSMHEECLSGLGLADFKVDKFVYPNKPWQWITHFAVFMTLFTFAFWPSSAFLPGSRQFPALFWSFGGLANWNARLAAIIKDYVLIPILLIHVAEAAYFSRNKLRKYWVERFTGLWWKWTGCVFLGGVAGMSRFDDYVAGIERERNRKGEGKH